MKLGEREVARQKIARLKGTLQTMEWAVTAEPPLARPGDKESSVRSLAAIVKKQAQDIITYMRALERRRKKEQGK